MIAFSDTPSLATRYCDFGEHTRAILRELGYDDDAIASLREDNVVVLAEDEAEDEELATASS